MNRNGRKKTNGNGLTVLAIDPGCRHTGWSINTITPSGRLRVIDHGVLEHEYDPEANAVFFQSLLRSNMIVLIEDPPIIRVNASTSHMLAKIYGAILGVIIVSDVTCYERIPPKSWQHSILRDHYQKAKEDGKKIVAREKDQLLKALINKNITRKKEITSPHVIDTVGMTMFYLKRNGKEFETVVLKDVLLANSKRKKKTTSKKKRRRNGK